MLSAEKTSISMDPADPQVTQFLAMSQSSSSRSRPEMGRTSSVSYAASRIRRRNRLITSCLECRRRKLKCDKLNPCGNCTRSSRACIFLALTLGSAAQLKLTEIKEKMGSLEKTLERDVARRPIKDSPKSRDIVPLPGLGDEDSTDECTAPEDEQDLEPTPLATEDAAYYEDADGDLMDLGIAFGKVRLTERIGGLVRYALRGFRGLQALYRLFVVVVCQFSDISLYLCLAPMSFSG